MKPTVPIIDLSPLRDPAGEVQSLAAALRAACHEVGFFYLAGHGVSEELQARLVSLSQAFFALPPEEKQQIHISRGGRAWRGYFSVGEELTSGKPDLKEGLYFGAELPPTHPLVEAGTPMHGPNLFPAQLPALRQTVLEYIQALSQLGQQLMKALALSLGLEGDYFYRHFTRDPLTLFRIFHYPPADSRPEVPWGVGEHTDYGLITILKQDETGGLQIQSQGQWIEAPYIPNTFVCNIGDILERMTGGFYRSTPHRVRNTSGRSRLSFPFFFDPNFNAPVRAIDHPFARQVAPGEPVRRWDGLRLHEFEGTYGTYILGKVAQVFPEFLLFLQQQKANDR
ncbi:MAG: isopenicillin N synthase family oxygenase [Bacteroidetes bacterium]|nr:MAG: isopenicillin N synthase family oxygenase [Bacteroidota bacterium]